MSLPPPPLQSAKTFVTTVALSAACSTTPQMEAVRLSTSHCLPRHGSGAWYEHRHQEDLKVIDSLRAQVQWLTSTVPMPIIAEAEALMPLDMIGKKEKGGRNVLTLLRRSTARQSTRRSWRGRGRLRRRTRALKPSSSPSGRSALRKLRQLPQRLWRRRPPMLTSFGSKRPARLESAWKMDPCACGAQSAGTVCKYRTWFHCSQCGKVQKSVCKKRKCTNAARGLLAARAMHNTYIL
mmetsp:Transcript_22968/g.62324  ORF Transcript_22968/g.62324 Transcript_22968/m.62324 type:complete len:237 (-) Transcript_22968:15-725(-)